MLVWINGAFGAGKTSVASELQRLLSEAIVFDPELLGDLARSLSADAPCDDFQDIPYWRTLVGSVGATLATSHPGPVIVPMTVVDPSFFAEICAPLLVAGVNLHAFTLIVPKQELRRRITAQVVTESDPDDDERTRRWRLAQVDRCCAALDVDSLGERIPNHDRSIRDVAINMGLPPSSQPGRPGRRDRCGEWPLTRGDCVGLAGFEPTTS